MNLPVRRFSIWLHFYGLSLLKSPIRPFKAAHSDRVYIWEHPTQPRPETKLSKLLTKQNNSCHRNDESTPFFCQITVRFLHLFHGLQGDTCSTGKNEVPGTFRSTSCLDYLLRDDSTCGMYRIYDDARNNFPAFCDFKSEPGTAWILVMSWANKHRSLPAFNATPFKNNAPINVNSHNWEFYLTSKTEHDVGT